MATITSTIKLVAFFCIMALGVLLAPSVSAQENNGMRSFTILKACKLNLPPRVYFQQGDAKLSEGDKNMLDTLICFMQDYPTMALSIYTYADSAEILGGDSVTRYHLAMLRAELAKSYLISKGFDANRLMVRDMTSGKTPTTMPKGAEPPLHGRRLEFYIVTAKRK